MFNTTQLSEEEQKMFDFDERVIKRFLSELDKGTFYLGGQLKMKPNDIINLDSVEKVREIDKKRMIEYGGPCNSFEAASMYQHNQDLIFVENMIKKYNQIMLMREKSDNRL
jgi:hypothetical protein